MLINKILKLVFLFFVIFNFSFSFANWKSGFQKINLDFNNISYKFEVGLFTDHFDDNYKDIYTDEYIQYNENNHVFGAGIKTGTITTAIGTLDNSYYKRSYMFILGHNFYHYNNIDVDIDLGFFTGYDKKQLDAFYLGDVLVVPLITAGYTPEFLIFDSFSIKPKFRLIGLDAYTLNIEFNF